MKERPILFSGAMVRAILDGRKTQTQITIKAGGYTASTQAVFRMTSDGDAVLERWPKQEREMNNFGRCDRFKCPYGVPGDRLWVRESWRRWENGGRQIAYRADLRCFEAQTNEYGEWFVFDGGFSLKSDPGKGWKPSIHMPRWASRITLEITDVRVHRVQEISEEDAQAEGVAPAIDDGLPDWTAKESFKILWDSINGKKHPGAANPWIWAISFKPLNG